jgi:hypothetical protein
MKPGDLERIRIVTRHFADLQGLRGMVPLGLGFLAWGAIGLAGSAFFSIVCALVLVAAVLPLGLAAEGFYRRRLGEVEGLGTRERWEPAHAPYRPRYFGGIEGPLIWPAVAGRPVVHSPAHDWPIAEYTLTMLGILGARALGERLPAQGVVALYVLSAIALILRWSRLERMPAQVHYLVLGALLLAVAVFRGAAVALVPVLGRIDGGMVLVGGAWIVAGLLDHRTLEQVLRPAGTRRGLFARVRGDAEEMPWEEMQRQETR